MFPGVSTSSVAFSGGAELDCAGPPPCHSPRWRSHHAGPADGTRCRFSRALTGDVIAQWVCNTDKTGRRASSCPFRVDLEPITSIVPQELCLNQRLCADPTAQRCFNLDLRRAAADIPSRLRQQECCNTIMILISCLT